MTLVKGNVHMGVIRALDPTGRASGASQRHVGAQPARGPHTSTMGAARYMAAGRLDLGLSVAYSASQTLIFGTGGRRRTNRQPSATRQRSGVGLLVN